MPSGSQLVEEVAFKQVPRRTGRKGRAQVILAGEEYNKVWERKNSKLCSGIIGAGYVEAAEIGAKVQRSQMPGSVL